jgi:flagellar hook-associated protein 1 FlgK
MGTLTSLMHTALTALQADQTALNTTANNVANQHTVGYTRQVVQWQTNDSVVIKGNVSDGVNIGSGAVSQRDRILELRVQQQSQTQAQSAVVESTLTQVENIFSLSSAAASSSSTVLGTAMDKFWSSLTALSNNPADTSTRQSVLSAATGLASAFNSAANQVTQIKTSLDQQATSVVTQVNSLSATIADLNQKIAVLSPDKDAGTLEDARQAAIAQLSTYIGVDQATSENNGITLTTGSGQVLVGGNVAYTLSTATVGGAVHVFSTASSQDITSKITGGQLGGVIAARDTILPSISTSLDTLAASIATSVNAQSASGTDGNGNTGSAIFTTSSTGAGAASSISVASNDPKVVAAAATGEGSSGNHNAQALAALATTKLVNGTTASDFFASFLSQIGTAASAATSDNTQQQTTLTQLTTQRDALSAVSLDQEAANLTQYQRSYEAAARVFSIVNTMMAAAINLGQNTSVS